MFRFQLTRLGLKDGTTLEPAQVTVIVGPNNAGKSRFLKEIAGIATGQHTGCLLVTALETSMPASLDELRNSYDVERYQRKEANWAPRGLDANLCGGIGVSEGGSWPHDLQRQFANATPARLFSNFGRQLIAYLTTEHRLQLVQENDSPSDEHERKNLLQELYFDKKDGEQDLRARIKDAFNLEVALDFTTLRRMLLRIGGDFTDLSGDPRMARQVLSGCDKLDDQGDGLRAFVGIVVALLALRRDVFLIDEPETFLHPPQSFRIGAFLGEQASKGRQLIVATHSADVLRGVLGSRAQVKIIRIDRIGNTNSFRVLDTEQIKAILTDPLLGSARVLDGLFYSGAVVVEADADARFYHVVSTKCRQDLDLHFVNADNKQTVPRIMSVYRDTGVRCLGIVDFDVLNSATEFLKQLDALSLDEPLKNRAMVLRDQIARIAKETPPADRLAAVEKQLNDLLSRVSSLRQETFTDPNEEKQQQEKLLRTLESRLHELADTTKAWKEFKQRGRSALSAAEQSTFDELSAIVAARGLFINPCGELESTLTEHGIPYTSDKKQWISTALQVVAGLAVDEMKYPWRLMREIHTYLAAP